MVVDAAFQTADPSVFAAGTFCKFSRRLGKTLPMEKYNSKEVGQKLAEALLQAIDPAQAGADAPTDAPSLGVLPRAQEGFLPGKVHYFYAEKPELKPIAQKKVLQTDEDGRFTQMIFDEYDILRSIAYVGRQPIQSQNILSLLGLPSSYMNLILYRYSQGEIKDLMSFVEGTWATCLYQESTPELRLALHRDLLVGRDEMKDSLEALVAGLRKQQSGEPMDPHAIITIIEKLPMKIKETIQIKLLNFLEVHADHLPGYQVPPPDKLV
jgi:hypothetical protein